MLLVRIHIGFSFPSLLFPFLFLLPLLYFISPALFGSLTSEQIYKIPTFVNNRTLPPPQIVIDFSEFSAFLFEQLNYLSLSLARLI